MCRIVWLLFSSWLLWAQDKPIQPEQKARPRLGQPKAEPKQESSPAVTEARVESTTQGISKEKKKKEPPVHGTVGAGSGPAGRGAAGTAVVQDKKSGKWAVTAGGESASTKR